MKQKGRGFIAALRDEALENLAFLIDCTPKVDHLSIQLHVHLIEVPAPVAKAAHARDALPTNVAGEQRPKPVPPHPHCLVANVDPSLEQQVLDVPEAERVLHIHHHDEADHLGG